MPHVRRWISVMVVWIWMATAGGAIVAAQDATPVGGSETLPNGCVVVADGLINPRYVAIGGDGTLYVTEAGSGGDEVLTPSQAEEAEEVVGTPEAAEATPAGEEGPPVTRGDTGQVTAILPDGTQTIVAEGFTSYSIGSGPSGIALGDGVIWISVGGGAVEAGVEALPGENSIIQLDLATGDVSLVAELGTFEEENNPDGTDVNPNLYGMDLGADGQLYVNDAGGNAVYRVDPATGEFSLVGVVPGPELPDQGTPEADATPIADEELGGAIQPVPTGLHVGDDGNVYTVTLGAFAPGASQVLIVQADGSFEVAASGLTVGIGVTLGPDGALYVSQLATFAGEQPGPGNVVRIGADGTVETVVEDVPFAHGITFDAAGNLYVVANSTVFGPPPAEPNGQVLRCDGIAAPA